MSELSNGCSGRVIQAFIDECESMDSAHGLSREFDFAFFLKVKRLSDHSLGSINANERIVIYATVAMQTLVYYTSVGRSV